MDSATKERVNAVRHFNRFITSHIGALQEGLLHSLFSLTESRILYEIANGEKMTVSRLTGELGLDTGYVSRLITRLDELGLIYKERSEADGRRRILHLTEKGENEYSILNQRSHDEVVELLSGLPSIDQQKLIDAMETVEQLLNQKERTNDLKSYILRGHKPGDMGMIVHKHGLLYDKEYGWDERFEALVCQIAADFINNFKRERENCWVAEMDGEVVGSVFVVEESERVAKLRLLLVDPKARGLGLGTRLVEECISFAKSACYEKLVLWTNSILHEARHIYKKTGFKLVAEENHHSFGHDLIGETWEIELY